MTAPWLTVIVPTIGRAHLHYTLASIRCQAGPEVEILVAGDTHAFTFAQALAGIEEVYAWAGIRYLPIDGGAHDWGGSQRTAAQREAQGDWLLYLQDDNCLVPGALAAVRAEATRGPREPILARVCCYQQDHWCVLWQDQELRCGNIDGDGILTPNDPTRLPAWGARYQGDWDFAEALVAAWGGQFRWWDYVLTVGSIHETGGLGAEA